MLFSWIIWILVFEYFWNGIYKPWPFAMADMIRQDLTYINSRQVLQEYIDTQNDNMSGKKDLEIIRRIMYYALCISSNYCQIESMCLCVWILLMDILVLILCCYIIRKSVPLRHSLSQKINVKTHFDFLSKEGYLIFIITVPICLYHKLIRISRWILIFLLFVYWERLDLVSIMSKYMKMYWNA